MKSLLKWALARSPGSACVIGLAIGIAVQTAGYGVHWPGSDLVCALMLIGAAGLFHVAFINAIGKLDQGAGYGSLAVEDKIHVAVTGGGAFLFSALGAVMLVRGLMQASI